MNFNAKTINDILTPEECSKIVNFAESSSAWVSGGGDFWDNRVMNDIEIYQNNDKEIGLLIHSMRDKLKKKIMEAYDLKQEIYPDIMQLVRWFPGMEQTPHWDDMSETADHEVFEHRVYGAIVYLNNNFKGGKTYYPNFNISIKPNPGMLAVHPGDSDHLHGVTKIEDGIRYTIASFWSINKEFDSGWSIHQ